MLWLVELGLGFDNRKVGLLNKYNKTRCLANHLLSSSYSQAILWLPLAASSYGYISYFKSDKNVVKGKVGTLNKFNKTRCLANLMQIN